MTVRALELLYARCKPNAWTQAPWRILRMAAGLADRRDPAGPAVLRPLGGLADSRGVRVWACRATAGRRRNLCAPSGAELDGLFVSWAGNPAAGRRRPSPRPGQQQQGNASRSESCAPERPRARWLRPAGAAMGEGHRRCLRSLTDTGRPHWQIIRQQTALPMLRWGLLHTENSYPSPARAAGRHRNLGDRSQV
jgi:hypothetical protein